MKIECIKFFFMHFYSLPRISFNLLSNIDIKEVQWSKGWPVIESSQYQWWCQSPNIFFREYPEWSLCNPFNWRTTYYSTILLSNYLSFTSFEILPFSIFTSSRSHPSVFFIVMWGHSYSVLSDTINCSNKQAINFRNFNTYREI